MNRYFASFVKVGDPGAAGGPTWPKFDMASEPLIDFPVNGTPAVRNHFHKERLDWVEGGAKAGPVRMAFEKLD
jgi:para-nitrobenzyl esterase